MAETISHQMDAEETAFEIEVKQMSAEADRYLVEMKQMQPEIERLREGNLARLTRIEAALDRLLSK